jgi:hypothetical protein
MHVKCRLRIDCEHTNEYFISNFCIILTAKNVVSVGDFEIISDIFNVVCMYTRGNYAYEWINELGNYYI